jgi:hypothetical protein
MKVEEIISDQQIDEVWGDSCFGQTTKRELIATTLLKCACGYEPGKTAKHIVGSLGLATVNKWTLTKLGKQYLWAAYSAGFNRIKPTTP